jgi:hypothetical protein
MHSDRAIDSFPLRVWCIHKFGYTECWRFYANTPLGPQTHGRRVSTRECSITFSLLHIAHAIDISLCASTASPNEKQRGRAYEVLVTGLQLCSDPDSTAYRYSSSGCLLVALGDSKSQALLSAALAAMPGNCTVPSTDSTPTRFPRTSANLSLSARPLEGTREPIMSSNRPLFPGLIGRRYTPCSKSIGPLPIGSHFGTDLSAAQQAVRSLRLDYEAG